MAYIAEHAPIFSSTGKTRVILLKEELEMGSVDLAIGIITQLEAGFLSKDGYLTKITFVLMRKRHPYSEGNTHVRKNFF